MDALERGGVDAVKVQALSRALGVTKGSFYWHFKTRDALLMAVLDFWESAGTQDIISTMESADLAPEDRPQALWQIVTASGRMGAEMALRDWARRDPRAQEVVERVDRQRLDFTRQMYEDLGHDTVQAEARSILGYCMLIGLHFVGNSGREVPEEEAVAAALALLTKAPD